MGSERDRIGDLPEHIITRILSCLPTKDAAATGILSKSWRLYWTQATTFDVEEPNDSVTSIQGIQFGEFVKAVLNNLDAKSIHKCRYRWINIHPVWYDVNPILRFKALKVLDMASQSKTSSVLQEIFTAKTLEVVKLGGSFEVKLPDAVCLPRLVDLELNAIQAYESDETVRELISSSPVLESLTIKRTSLGDNLTVCTISSLSLKRLHVCFDYEVEVRIPSTIVTKLKIAAPALEYLVLHDSLSEQVSILQGLTSANEADIHLSSFYAGTNYLDWDRYHTAHHNSTVGVLETLHGVTSLRLSDDAMIGLTRSRKNLPPNFKRLTKLAVKYDYDQLDCLVDLMDRCVNLQVLEIHWLGEAFTNWGSLIWWYPLQYPRCLSLSLKQVTFRSSWGCLEDVLPMLKFILYNGVVVERVNLCFDMMRYYWHKDHVCTEEELRRSVLTVLRDRMEEVCKFVSGLHRASPTCEIYTRIGDSGSWDRILH